MIKWLERMGKNGGGKSECIIAIIQCIILHNCNNQWGGEMMFPGSVVQE